jgi:MYXO-CTERM domain-containing protein
MSSSRNRRSFALRRAVQLSALGLLAGALAIGCGSSPSGSGGATSSAPATTTLTRSLHPLATPDRDVGRVEPDRRLEGLSVFFKMSAAQLRDREALLRAQQDPSSPDYRKWLTPAEYARRFGASPAVIDQTRSWLAKNGLEVGATSPLGSRVTFSGSVAQFERAFGTELHYFQVGTERHYAVSRAPVVPAEIGEQLLGIHNAHDFHAKPVFHSEPMPDATCPRGVCRGNGLAPPDVATIYDINALYSGAATGTKIDGTGIDIAVVGIAEVATSDVDKFRSTYGLPATHLVTTLVPGTGAAAGGTGGAGGEAILDIEWSGAIAPNATIHYVFTGGPGDGNVDNAGFYAVENNVAPIISESFGGCETYYTSADLDIYDSIYSAANLEGITYLASSGDSGATSCQGATAPATGGLTTSMPASFSQVTAVGGTMFPTGAVTWSPTTGYATGYPTEEDVWNDMVGSGGGGISNVVPRPWYQSGLTTCTPLGTLPSSSIVAANQRMVPDVSFPAAKVFTMCTVSSSGDCAATGGTPQTQEIWGTSASTPMFAGVLGLVLQATGAGRLGNANPLLYSLAASSPNAFHDITHGNNYESCKVGTDPGCDSKTRQYGYAATAGYDCGSGLGSLEVQNLVKAWAAATPTSITLTPGATTTTEGATLHLSSSITVPKPNSSDVTGRVSYIFKSYLADGTFDESWDLADDAIVGGATTGASDGVDVKLPPGMVNAGAQYVDVMASYSGDSTHLASVSATSRITFGPVALCTNPTTLSLKAGATTTLAAFNGIGGYRWIAYADTTCDAMGNNCSTLDEKTGKLVAGTGQAGWVLVAVVDDVGAETFVEVTVGSPTATAANPLPWGADSGILTHPCPAIGDAGTDASGTDGGATDSGSGATDSGVTPTDSGSGATDSGVTPTDSGSSATDSGVTPTDSGSGATDSGVTPTDSGSGATDSGVTPTDSGSSATDSGVTPTDSGSSATDSGVAPTDSGSSATDSGSSATDSGSEPADTGSTTVTSTGGDASTTATSGGSDGGATDASATGNADANVDAGPESIGGGASCNCTTVGQGNDARTPASMFALSVLGLGLVRARRRRR